MSEEKTPEQAAEMEAKKARAVLYLHAHGKTPGIDYTDALGAAANVRFDELVAEKVKGGGPFSFSGDDYCEGCSGWDGESKRCGCGNRRVSWSSHGDFEDMYVFGEAY